MCLDINKAILYLTQSAEQENEWAAYQLGKLFLLGKDVPKDIEKAVSYLTKSAEQGNKYARFFLDNIDKFREPSVALGISKMMYHVGRIFENNVSPLTKSAVGFKVDSKLMRKMREKKVGQGV